MKLDKLPDFLEIAGKIRVSEKMKKIDEMGEELASLPSGHPEVVAFRRRNDKNMVKNSQRNLIKKPKNLVGKKVKSSNSDDFDEDGNAIDERFEKEVSDLLSQTGAVTKKAAANIRDCMVKIERMLRDRRLSKKDKSEMNKLVNCFRMFLDFVNKRKG